MKLQAIILQLFWKRLRHEFLTSLREFRRSSGDYKQKGDVVLVQTLEQAQGKQTDQFANCTH